MKSDEYGNLKTSHQYSRDLRQDLKRSSVLSDHFIDEIMFHMQEMSEISKEEGREEIRKSITKEVHES